MIRRAAKKTVVGIYKVMYTVHFANTLRIETIECINNESLGRLWCMYTSRLHKLFMSELGFRLMIVAKMDIPFSLQGIMRGPLSESDCSS